MVAGDIPTPVDVIVLGGGPGGYTTAARAAELGHQVVLVERDALGGACLNVGCIPSKALITAAHDLDRARHRLTGSPGIDWAGLQAWKQGVVDELVGGVGRLLSKVQIVRGTGRLLDGNRVTVETPDHAEHFRYRHCILATGSRPALLRSLPLDGERVVDSTGALSLSTLPARMVVVGGGYIGMELGMAYARLGTRVSVVEALGSVLAGFDPELTKVVVKRAGELEMRLLTGTEALGLTEGGLHIRSTGTGNSAADEVLAADVVLVAVGRRPNTDDLQLDDIGLIVGPDGLLAVDAQCRTAAPGVFAIGDITPGPALAHRAAEQGRVAAEVIAGLPSAFDQVVPLIAFTDPEIASVGLTEAEAAASGVAVVVGRSRFAHSGRALTLGETAGFVKVVADATTQVVVGVQVAGPSASDLISEGTILVELGARLEDVARTIHPHPTLGESMAEAAMAARTRSERSR